MKLVYSVQAIKYPLTGIGRYALELGRHLQSDATLDDLRFAFGDRFVPALPSDTGAEKEPGTLAKAISKTRRLVARNKVAVDLYRAYKSKTAKNPFAGMDDYVFHGTNYYVPDFPGKSIATMHDLSVLTMPQFHPRERVNYLSKEIEASLSRVSALLVDSHHVKQEIIDHFGMSGDTIHVAHLASSEDFRTRTQDDIAPALARHGLTYAGYTLYAGTIEPRKNLANLIKAYATLPATTKTNFPLVLVGFKGWNNDEIMDEVAKGTRQGWVKYLGFVPDQELTHLFSGARLFAFPSLYEGFGLPVLEALSSGVPVVTSNRSSLPEVGGDAALYSDPDDVERLGQLCRQGLEDDAWRAGAIERGFAHAKSFSWQKCADQTVAAYRQVGQGQ